MYLWPGRKEEVPVLNCSSAELQVGIQTTVTQSHHVPSAFQREDPPILFANIEPFSKGVPQQKKLSIQLQEECIPFTRSISLPSCMQTDRSGRSGSSVIFSCNSRVKSESHAATTLASKPWSGQSEAEGGQGILSTCHMIFTQPSDIVCLCMQFWIWRGRALQVERPLGMP